MFLPSLCLALDQEYFSELKRKALKRELWSKSGWHVLLHYQKNFFGNSVKSKIGKPQFFYSEKGRVDPKAELIATIKAILETEETQENHAQCRFPARYNWLKSELEIDTNQIKEKICQQFQEWYDEIQPAGITLVFPSAFINNPASTFGHTLLRIDRATGSNTPDLLSFSASFAAATAGENALLYAAKGLFGGYDGYFSIMPYYEKVEQYAELENRDIWEYQLNLTQKQIDQIVRHLWEVQTVPFTYYYLDDNCSYQLLSILDLINPEQLFSKEFNTWVVPIDTVKVVLERKGLLQSVKFRPAAATKVRTAASVLKRELWPVAKNLAQDPSFNLTQSNLGLTNQEKAQSLELAYDYQLYLKLSGKQKSTKAHAYKLLVERSKVDQKSSSLKSGRPHFSPDQGHGTSRLGAIQGYQQNNRFTEFHWRPAYHDLVDSQSGFKDGAQLEFLDTHIRYTYGKNLTLERLALLDILSLSARDYFIRPLSWRLLSGLQRKIIDSDKRKLYYRNQLGAGRTWRLSNNSLFYMLAESALDLNTRFKGNFAWGGGARVGFTLQPHSNYRISLNSEGQRFFLGEHHTDIDLKFEQAVKLDQDLALKSSYLRDWEFSNSSNYYAISFEFYF